MGLFGCVCFGLFFFLVCLLFRITVNTIPCNAKYIVTISYGQIGGFYIALSWVASDRV